MPALTYHKMKAVLLVAMLATPEARHIQQSSHTRRGLQSAQSGNEVAAQQAPRSSEALATLLLAHHPTNAFMPSGPAGQVALSSVSRPASADSKPAALNRRIGRGRHGPEMRETYDWTTHRIPSEVPSGGDEALPLLPLCLSLLASIPLPALADIDPELAAALPEAVAEQSPNTVPSLIAGGATLFVAIPGLTGLIKRSTKAKIVRKTYEVLGPKAEGGRPIKMFAAEMIAYFQANNYRVVDATEAIVFEGKIGSEIGTAFFLAFCTLIGAVTLSLVAQTAEFAALGKQVVGNWWFLSTATAPATGLWYMENGQRTDQVAAKIYISDDLTYLDVVVQGDQKEIDRFQKTLDLREKGMEYVEGLLDKFA